MSFVDRWNERERKLEEGDTPEEEKEEKERIDVVTESNKEEEEDNKDKLPFSGMFCVWCDNFAIYMFKGNSLCNYHKNEEFKKLLDK